MYIPKSAEIIRPLLRGRDIKQFSYEFADQYLLFIPWHFPLHNDPSITGASLKAEKEFENQYFAIYNHLLKYKKELSNRNKAETGIRYEWYALQRWGANYWEDFSKQKIVWARLMRISKNEGNSFPRFSLVPEDTFTVDSLCFITGEKLDYLIQILNSKVAAYYFFNNIAILDNGGMQMRQQYVENFPIPKYNEVICDNLIDDGAVFSLYNFNKDEIVFITQFLKNKYKEIGLNDSQ